MISGVKNKVRNVIPRWRKYSVAAARGELSTVPKKRSIGSAEMPAIAHDRNLRAWTEEPSLCNASELVLSATVTNRREEQVKAAAIQIARSGSRLVSELRALADRILDASPDDRFGRIPQIRATRNFTYSEPRNPMGWADLALAYSSKGQINKAGKALKVALSLAPNNRHVLRSTAAYYVHLGDAERAHDLLVRCEATPP